MKLYTYIANLCFEAEDEEDAEKLLEEYLTDGDCDLSLYEPGTWSLGDVTDLQEE